MYHILSIVHSMLWLGWCKIWNKKIETGKHIHALSGTFTHMHVRSSLLTNCDNSRNFCGYCFRPWKPDFFGQAKTRLDYFFQITSMDRSMSEAGQNFMLVTITVLYIFFQNGLNHLCKRQLCFLIKSFGVYYSSMLIN